MKLIDLFVIYQENGLPHEKMIEMPAGLSNEECINFVHASIGEGANIINIINVDSINRQKSTTLPPVQSTRPERKSDSRPTFGTRPYGSRSTTYPARKDDKPTGGYAKRSPRDGAKPGRAGFGSRPSRGDSRESRMGSSATRSKRPLSRG